MESDQLVLVDEKQDSGVEDYWAGPPAPVRHMLPDGKQWIEINSLTHGQRSQYNARTAREMSIQRATGEAKIKTDLSGDQNILLEIAISDWNLYRNGQPVPFSKGSPGSNLSQWLGQAPPKIVDKLIDHVQEINDWLLGELDLKSLYEQRDEIQRQIDLKEKEERGKSS